MKKLFALALSSLTIVLLGYFKIVLFSEDINNIIIAIIALYWAICYKGEFKCWQNWIVSIPLIFVFGLMFELWITNHIAPELWPLPLILWFSSSFWGTIYLLERDTVKTLQKLLTLFVGCYLTFALIWGLILAAHLSMWLYPSVQERVYSKCLAEKCVDVYKTRWKLDFYTVYSYQAKYWFILYRMESPKIQWVHNQKHSDAQFDFEYMDGSYILRYSDETVSDRIKIK